MYLGDRRWVPLINPLKLTLILIKYTPETTTSLTKGKYVSSISTGTKSAGLRENFSAQIDFIHLHIYRDTFQNVRETTDKLKTMKKRMIDLSKKGEATEELEMYVSAFLSVMFLVKMK